MTDLRGDVLRAAQRAGCLILIQALTRLTRRVPPPGTKGLLKAVPQPAAQVPEGIDRDGGFARCHPNLRAADWENHERRQANAA
jgi:hypothetical protein